ncbi:MAG: GntR family transcriptional regulator, partial [Oligosphaeraceae bacterium]|nr:GntR family transcriptional regulator [Oligosphaeraceae bacterium]
MLWKLIYATEREHLLSGGWQPGQFFHTVGSLALKHGVSEITTRRVLSELSREGLLRNVPRVGSIVAERLANPRIFLLSPQQMGYAEETQVVSEIMKGIFEAAFQCGWEVTPVSQDFLLSGYSEECHLLYLYNCNLQGSDEFLPQVPENMHLLGLHAPGPMPRGTVVCNDYQAAIRQQVTDLAREYRRIAYIGPVSGRWFQSRYETYLATLRSCGRAVPT